MFKRLRAPAGEPELRAVEHRGAWVAWGLCLQAIGVGIPVTVALRRASREGLLGSVTHYTVRLVWHETLRSRADVALVVLGVVVFATGGMVLARPFVKRRSVLFAYVPVTAAVGVAVLGVVALIVAVVIAIISDPGDVDWNSLLSSFSSWLPGSRRRRK